MGWSDDNGNIIKEIKPGTTDIKVHSNWTSNRNQTIPNDYLNKEYITIDNSKNGQYIFVFDIGTIVNVPLYTIKDFSNAVGMSVSESYTTSITIGEEQAKSVNETIANATTKSTSWTLSKDWNELVTEVKGQDHTITDESTISISNGSSQAYTQSYGESVGTSDSIAVKNGQSSKKIGNTSFGISNEVSDSRTDYDIFEGGGVEVGVGVFEAADVSIGIDINGKWGNEKTHSNSSTGSIGGSVTEEDEFFSELNQESNRSWSASTGTSLSASISQDKTTANSVAESISNKFEYAISKSIGGSESASTSDTTTNTNEKGYSSTFAYNTERNETKISTWTNSGAPAGWYRLVCAGKVHVFAVVCYDIASSNYCTYTYSILDDDVYDFYDYSKNDKYFKDYNNGVLPFEVPVSVNEYVTKAISCTKGLTVERSTGMIDSYNGETKNVWIPDNFIANNGDGTYDIIQVKGIKTNVFQGNSNINSVRLSSYITNIPDNAFKNCTSLKHIYSNNLETIGNSAFAKCSSLVDVEHDNLKSIGNNAFEGCTQLADFEISSKVQSVGNTAFNGVNKVTTEANNANVVSSIAKCGAKSVTVDLGKMSNELRNVTITTNITDNFTLNGKSKTLNNVSIESSAETTTLSRITFTNNQKTALRINSQNLNLNQVNIENSMGLTMILEAENTNIYLRGKNTFKTTSKNAALCKNINISLIPGTSETTKLSVPQGDILVCGDQVYSNLLDASIRTINQTDFENMISSHTVYFDANGGSVPTQSKSVAYNSTYGTLPTPTKDYYCFDGWFTTQTGGTKVNSDDIFTGDTDITLYAHWSPKQYTVCFNGNGGTANTPSKTVSYNSTYGSLPSAQRDYYDFAGWYTAASGGTRIYDSTVFTGSSDITLYAHWEQKPLLGWTLASNVPSNAKIEERKWTYTLREYTENSSSSLNGWTKYDTRRTGWGSTQGPVYYDPSNGERNVWSESYVIASHYKTVYHYYRYSNSYTGGKGSYTNYYSNYYQYDFDWELEETSAIDGHRRFMYWYCDTNWTGVYMCDPYTTQEWDYDEYGTRWYFQDPIYTYYYYRDVNKESGANPSGSNISNVQEWVKYRAK